MGRAKKTDTAGVGGELVAVAGNMGKGLASYVAGRALPYTPPWIGAAALPPLAGWATNAMWGDTPLSAGLATAGIALSGAALSVATWKQSPATTKFRKFRRAQATASVAAGMGWLTAATAAGPFGSPLLDLWLMGGALFAASWNVRQIMGAGQGGDPEVEENTGGTLGKLAAAIGWEKVAVKDAQGNGKGVVKAQIEVAPSSTIDAVQSTASKVAAALQVPPAGVIVTPDPDDASRGTVAIRVADLLRAGVPFTMPDALGLDPTHPAVLGQYADGETWWIDPYSAPILQHVLVMGTTGAGKSEVLRTLVTHFATRRKMSIFLIDLAKGRQTVGHIAPGIDWLVQDAKEAKRLLKSLPAAIKARGSVLADEGLDQWTPASSLNAVLVWVEEAADLAGFDELDEIARKARSVGIWLGISLQRATWANVSTDVRANLQGSICMGVDQASDASFCLPDSVTDAGAVPAWGSNRPGYGFATGMGIPQDRWTTETRSALTDRNVLAALVDAAALWRDPLDDTTAAALGQTYAQRAGRGTNRTTPGAAERSQEAMGWLGSMGIEFGAEVMASPGGSLFPAYPGGAQAAPPAPRPVPPAVVPVPLPAPAYSADQYATTADIADDGDEFEDTTMIEQTAEIEIQDVYDEILGTIPGDPEPDADYAHLGLEDDVPDEDPDSDMEFEQPQRMSTEEARHTLYAELDGWVQSGRLEFEPADLIPATVATGRKRPWMQGELKRLTEDGILQRDGHGAYTILHSPLQPA
ncbi:FtsK/SpoIIIE domain-containing protein [Streptomyces sp. NPDC093111]|uniref:FtsK/SpoIIIE domain-containing protein n=1 Tax=Streptomyces sp. NPDC093111 TaxID=3154978 RepID=UPI0034360B94